jgi:hypothetical protein
LLNGQTPALEGQNVHHVHGAEIVMVGKESAQKAAFCQASVLLLRAVSESILTPSLHGRRRRLRDAFHNPVYQEVPEEPSDWAAAEGE